MFVISHRVTIEIYVEFIFQVRCDPVCVVTWLEIS